MALCEPSKSFYLYSSLLYISILWLLSICTLLITGETTPAAVLILSRGGSKGIPLKNLQQIGGQNLICNSVRIAKQAGFDDVTVSTDHPLIALEALKCNTSIFHRSKVTATDWAPSIWGAVEFVHHRPEVEILILMQATSPFLRPSHLKGALNKIQEPTAYDCIFSVVRSHKLRWHFSRGQLRPLNFNADHRPRRQDWAGEYCETGSFYITRKSLVSEGRFQNHNCTIWEITELESLEIDSYYDLQVANALLKANLI